MELKTTQNITLDFTVQRLKNIRCVEDDRASRIINIVVTNNCQKFPLDPDTMIARYKIHKPDHTYIYNNAVINNDGTVTITLPDQAMTIPGLLHSALQVSQNGNIISTMPFNIIVEKSVYSNNDIESQNESDVLNDMINHIEDYENPHKTTKEQIGLGNADNTSDMDKPVSNAQQAALDEKIDKTTVATAYTLGLVRSGTDITVDNNGNVSINDNSHNHTVSNITDMNNYITGIIHTHNTSSTTHDDIRQLIIELTTRLNALADSDDTTLDQLSEIVAYVKSNRSLIENVTTNKVNVSDIIDNLTSTATNKPLSAKQGKVLNDLITALTATVENKVDKVSGKGLSTNDYTTAEKEKLNGIDNMIPATASTAGKSGLVPTPPAGAQEKYLRGDGTWQAPTVNASDNTKLPLVGGTLTGALNMHGTTSSIVYDGFASTGTNAKGLSFKDTSGNTTSAIGAITSSGNGIPDKIYLAVSNKAWNNTEGLTITKDDIKWKGSNLLTDVGDTQNNVVTFESGDSTQENSTYTNVPVLTSGETHKSILNKISLMFKNIRYLFKIMGTCGMSGIGDGTVTGAIYTLNNTANILSGSLARRMDIAAGGTITINAGQWVTNVALIVTSGGSIYYIIVWSTSVWPVKLVDGGDIVITTGMGSDGKTIGLANRSTTSGNYITIIR